MANPQPDIFIAFSKELWDAICKCELPRAARQVFDAIASLTYGANPRVKKAQISNKMIIEKTGLRKECVSRRIKLLLQLNMVVKNHNYRPPIIGINKDYEKWKKLSKITTIRNEARLRGQTKKKLSKITTKVVKNHNQKKFIPFSSKKEKRNSSHILNFYKTEINPLRKSSVRAKKNIEFYLKKYSFEDLKKSIKNYASILDGDNPKYRKDPANFFGKNEKYFFDYLPENFEPVEKEDPDKFGPWAKKPIPQHIVDEEMENRRKLKLERKKRNGGNKK